MNAFTLTTLPILAGLAVAATARPPSLEGLVDHAVFTVPLEGYFLSQCQCMHQYPVLKNTGTTTWSASEGYALVLERTNNLRLAIPAGVAVAPGESIMFDVEICGDECGSFPPPPGSCGGQAQMRRNDTPFGEAGIWSNYIGWCETTPTATATPTATPSPSPTPDVTVGDLDGSGCTDVADFLLLLDRWEATLEGIHYDIHLFLGVIDHWRQGAACGQ